MSQKLPLHTPRLTPDARSYLRAVYLDYFNHYLTAEKFAEHNGLTIEQARLLLAVAKDVHENQHPEE